MAHPGSLSELALDTLGKYVYDLCSELTMIQVAELSKSKSKKRKSTCTTDINKVKYICSKLHGMLAEVPVNLVNELTNKLIDSLDNWEFEVGKCREGSLEEQIYTEILTGVIHPAVSSIEPGQNLFECSDIFAETVFCSSLCARLIIKNAHTLKNLRKLHVLLSNLKCNFKQVEFPEQLTEFSGRCNDELLFKILKSCKNLRYLYVFGSRGVTDASVHYILKLSHLEKLNISNTRITHNGIKKLIEGFFEKVGKLPPLKFLAFSCSALHHFKCLENFSNLTISLQLDPYGANLDVSPLYRFRNIRELKITTTLNSINKILKEIGSQLVLLDVEIEHFGPLSNDDEDDDEEEEENWDIAEILKVGQYCKSLKCLHISISYYFFSRMLDFVRPPLQGFQTVRCLTLDIEDEDTFEASDFFNFLISQCVNVKKVILEFDRRIFNVHEFMCNIIQLGYMKNVEFICFQPLCARCAIDMDGENNFDQSKVDEILQLLIVHCQNLRVIGLDPSFQRNCEFNSQRLKFVPTWCNCK